MLLFHGSGDEMSELVPLFNIKHTLIDQIILHTHSLPTAKCAIVDYINAMGSGWMSTLELNMNNSEL